MAKIEKFEPGKEYQRDSITTLAGSIYRSRKVTNSIPVKFNNVSNRFSTINRDKFNLILQNNLQLPYEEGSWRKITTI